MRIQDSYLQPSILAIIILIAIGALVFIFARRENMGNKRTYVVPCGNRRLIMIASVMLAISGIACRMITQFNKDIPSEPSLWAIGALLAAGILFCLGERHRWLPPTATLILSVAIGMFYSGFVSDIVLLPIQLSVLFLFLSTIGWRYNIVFTFLPKRVALPMLNLLSIALAILYIPAVARGLELQIIRAGMTPIFSYVYAFVTVLPLVSVLLINVSCEIRTAEIRFSKVCTRAVAPGGSGFISVSWFLLICGVANMLAVMFRSYDTRGFLLSLPLIGAGLLMVTCSGNEKRFIAATVCLFLSVSVNFFNPATYTTVRFWTYCFPILLMLISATGVGKNDPPAILSKLTKAPILNILASILLIIGIAINTPGFIDKSSSYAESIGRNIAAIGVDGMARAEIANLCLLVLSFLISIGLALLNLTFGSRQISRRSFTAWFIRVCRRVFSWFYRDVGGKLQSLAKIQAFICMVVACLSALTGVFGLCGFFINIFFTGYGLEHLTLFLLGIGGMIASFILALPTWTIYAFGQITEDVHMLKENSELYVPEYLEENPDDLPEL